MILNLEVLGVRQAMLGLTGVLQRIDDLRPLAEPWDKRFRANAEKHFTGEGTHKGQWPALARATQIDRERHGYPPAHPILVRTGDMLRSLTRGGGDHILDAHKKWIEFGTSVPYAVWHQIGSRDGKHPPQRLMIALEAFDVSRMIQDAREYIMGGHVGLGA